MSLRKYACYEVGGCAMGILASLFLLACLVILETVPAVIVYLTLTTVLASIILAVYGCVKLILNGQQNADIFQLLRKKG